MESFFFWLWSVSVLFSGYQVMSSNNPIMSVFFLMVAFLNAGFLLLLLGLEFLPILFCMVYGGAIGIMFLFVVMLLNIKLLEINENVTRYVPMGMIIGFIFLYQMYFSISIYEGSWEMFYFTELLELNNIEELGSIIYTDYFLYFLISSLVLLVSMIGAIVLCLYHEEVLKRQDLFEFMKTVVNVK